MKKFTAIFLATCMMASCLIGCGSKSTESSSNETPATEPASTEEDKTAEPAADDASGENPTVTLRIAHQSAETEGIAMAFEKFKDELEAANVGFEVTIYPAGQLVASDRDSIEAVTLGEVDVTSVADIQFSSTVSAFYLFNAEFLFDSIDDAYDAFYKEGLFDKLAQATTDANVGCEVASIWANGGRTLWTTGKEVRSADDMKGLPLRCAENEINIAEMEALGAVPVSMAWNEIYTGLQQGTVNGLFSTKSAIVQQGMTAALDYCIDTNHSFGHAITLMNTAKLNSLTGAQREAYDNALKVATEYQWDLAREAEASIDARIEEEVEYIHLTDEERAAMAEIMVGATEDMVKELLGDDAAILDSVRGN